MRDAYFGGLTFEGAYIWDFTVSFGVTLVSISVYQAIDLSKVRRVKQNI